MFGTEVATVHIAEMKIDGGPPFGGPPFRDPVEFKFHERVNLFIGPNATGKTSIVRMLSHPHYYNPDQFGHQHAGWQFWFTLSDGWPTWQEGDGTYPNWLAVPFIHIGATRLSLPLTPEKPTALPGKYDEVPLEDIFSHCYETNIFDANAIEPALRLLMREAENRGGEIGINQSREAYRAMGSRGRWKLAEWNLQDAINTSYQCAQAICTEVVAGQTAANSVSQSPRIGIFQGASEIRPAASIQTHSNGQLDIEMMSSGIQSSLLWIRFLALKMVYHYQFEEGWQNQPAILLIDEIENHLHPTWQRRVIPALLEHFPGLQIFATTHSPFVVAGLKAGQVHLLNRDANGVVTATTNEQDIIGWTADEILRTMMGVQDPTDDATAAAARELRQLRDEGPRPEPVDEEQRRERMQELRQLVDRDLLAGGPMAARRELFEQQFAAALEKHRQSQELNQDNG